MSVLSPSSHWSEDVLTWYITLKYMMFYTQIFDTPAIRTHEFDVPCDTLDSHPVDMQTYSGLASGAYQFQAQSAGGPSGQAAISVVSLANLFELDILSSSGIKLCFSTLTYMRGKPATSSSSTRDRKVDLLSPSCSTWRQIELCVEYSRRCRDFLELQSAQCINIVDSIYIFCRLQWLSLRQRLPSLQVPQLPAIKSMLALPSLALQAQLPSNVSCMAQRRLMATTLLVLVRSKFASPFPADSSNSSNCSLLVPASPKPASIRPAFPAGLDWIGKGWWDVLDDLICSMISAVWAK